MRHHSGSRSRRALLFPRPPLCAPRCFDNLALLNAQSNNSSCGEQRGDTQGEREGKKEVLAAGPIDKQSRSCDLFTAVCYVEARAARRKAF